MANNTAVQIPATSDAQKIENMIWRLNRSDYDVSVWLNDDEPKDVSRECQLRQLATRGGIPLMYRILLEAIRHDTAKGSTTEHW